MCYLTREEKYWLNHKIINNILHRLCSTCKEWLPETIDYFYYKNKSKPEKGYSSECKSCSVKRTQVNIEGKKEQYLDYWSKYHKKIYEEDSKYRQNRIDFANQQREDGYQLNWQKANPERCNYLSSLHRDHDVSTKEYEAMLKVFDYKCAYCGMTYEEHKKKFKERLHNDHVDDDGYNDLRNDAPACKSCNCGKHEHDMEGWFRKQKFFSEDKLELIKWWTSEGYKLYIEDKPPYRITKSRVYKEDSSYTYQFELWSVDEKRNMIECVAIGNKKKDLNKYIIN